MTIRQGFEQAIEDYRNIGNEEMVAFFEARLAQVEKKNSAPRKATPHQLENEAFCEDILAWMEPNGEYQLADIHKGVPSIVAAGISSSRVSACLTKLKNAGSLTAEKVKGKNVYRLA